MKKTIKAIAIILTAVMFISVLPLSAFAGDGGTTGNATWSYSSGTLTISGGTYMDSYDDITEVPWGVYGSSISEVYIGETITNIGDNAFRGMANLEYIYFNDIDSILTIGESAFSGCVSLQSIALGSHLVAIEEYAFNECSSLSGLWIPGSVNYIGEMAFCACTSLKELYLEDGVNHIYQQAFYNCYTLNKVHLNRDLESIGDFAFENCNSLTSMTVPKTCTSVGQASIGCKDEGGNDKPIPGFVVRGAPGSQAQYYAEYHNLSFENVYQGSVGGGYMCTYSFAPATGIFTVSGSDFMNDYEQNETPWYIFDKEIKKVVFAEGVRDCGNNAFYYCENLKSVSIPTTLFRIGQYAFAGTGLTAITLPEGDLGTIDNGAFNSCKGLTGIAFPDNVTMIGQYAFAACENLSNVSFNQTSNLDSIGGCAFFRTALKSICLPASVKTVSDYALGIYWDDTAFGWTVIPGFIIYAPQYTKGYEYATDEGITWECWHVWGPEVKTVEETCTKKGNLQRVCIYCSEAKNTEVPALGHKWDEGALTTPAGCESYGVKTFTCERCTLTHTENINPKGHDWNDGEITTAPTCTASGVKTYTCNNCSNKYTEVISATGHHYEAVVTPPKANALGFTTHTCSGCGDSYVDTYTAQTGKVAGFKCSARTAAAEKFIWNKMAGVSGYQIQISNAAGNAWATAKATTANTYLFSGLTAGANYKFRIRTYINKDGKNYFGPWSAIASPTLPAATTLKLTAAKNAFVAKWTKKAVTGYQLQYSLKANFAGAKTVTLNKATLAQYSVKGLKANSYYYVRIRTYKKIGTANYFSTWTTAKVKTK